MRRGWARIVLQSLYFGPSNLLLPEESFQQIVNKITVSPVVRVSAGGSTPCDLMGRRGLEAVFAKLTISSFLPPCRRWCTARLLGR